MNAHDIKERLGLLPHPEGGFYRETYRSADTIPAEALDGRYGSARAASTAIYFLLTGDCFSSFHRLKSDEFWHYHLGDPVDLHLIHPDGRHQHVVVGPDLASGQTPQARIPHGCWFAARVRNPHGFILLGCTVAPGFDFRDFELGNRAELLRTFPQYHDLITAFTHPAP
ncbi:MAG TPA: cupin domain-containing protein [Kiritimatiellia bacterium]|nr:cupin domain-containing protein [Kiritimatiellia bacterium]HMP33392.1 cupin domain-containing protein [Kiritimatiellia bacterium]